MVVEPIRGNRTCQSHVSCCFRPTFPSPQTWFPVLWESEPKQNLWTTCCFLGNWSRQWESQSALGDRGEEFQVFLFFFMDMNSCDWFISSYDLTEALVRCSRLHPHEALAGAGASLSAEKMWLGFLPSCWIQTSWKLRCYWAPKSRLFICFDIQIVSLFPGLLVLIYLLIGSWFNLRFQFSFFLLAPYFYS